MMGILHNGEILLSFKETMEYLEINRGWVTQLSNSGHLIKRKHVRGHRSVYFTFESVARYKQSLATGSTAMAARLLKLEQRMDALEMRFKAGQVEDLTQVLQPVHPHFFK